MEWGHDPEFHNWPDAPVYLRMNLSDLLDNAETLEPCNGVVEVRDDMGIEIEEAVQIKELLGDKFREIRLRPANQNMAVDIETAVGDDAKSVDEMVVEHLSLLDTEGSDYDAALLVKLYQDVGTA